MDVQTKRRGIGRHSDYVAGHSSCIIEEDETHFVEVEVNDTRVDRRWGDGDANPITNREKTVASNLWVYHQGWISTPPV
jgi:hypothetical protein